VSVTNCATTQKHGIIHNLWAYNKGGLRLQGMNALFNDLKVINNNIQNKKRHENNKTLVDTHLNDKKIP
jgi:hypothetical protein